MKETPSVPNQKAEKSSSNSPPVTDENRVSEEDFRGWVDDYGNRLFSFAMVRIKNRELAEDLVQETFLSAYRARNKFEGRSSVYTWLVRILKNKIVDHIRKRQRRPEVCLEEQDIDERHGLFNNLGVWAVHFKDWDQNPEMLLSRKDFQDQLQRCLHNLPEKYRTAFTMKVLDDLDADQVCEVLGVNTNNLWVILYRARMKLRTCLEKNWFEGSPNESKEGDDE